MCAIAGLYSLSRSPVDPGHVQKMCDLMRHRGPDDHGLQHWGHAVLGHRRLSIIDLSPLGRNPMPNEDETIWITCNGEIYNYRELRDDLTNRGHIFRSRTDTEVIIHLYEEYGPDCVRMLNGMFAFGLLDLRRLSGRSGSRLVLARDRFGVKPLYYTILKGTLAFASEVKAFLAIPDFTPRADAQGLAEHFTFQNTFGARTLFKDVNLLQAGHMLVCDDGTPALHQYWDLRFTPVSGLSVQDWAIGLRERFEVAVQRQLMSDVPLGSYLSGGMDTGSISAIAARTIPRMHTFTCGFDLPAGASELEQFFDEREESHHLARLLRTNHHELTISSADMFPALPRVVWHLDEPRVGISYQVYYTAQMIRQHVAVVLSGVGGDELFAGYPWRYEPVLGMCGKSFDAAYYAQWIRFLTDSEKRSFFSPSLNRELGDFSTFESFSKVLAYADCDDPLHRALYFDFKTFLNGLLLVDDKLSMAHSVEARVPFLDNDLVDYVCRIPADMKLQPGRSKLVLREAMRGLLPDETIDRRKQGFTPPDHTWYKQPDTLAYINEMLLGRRSLERDYFEPGYVRKIIDDHATNRKNNRFLIWSLMCFEWWNRLFVDREMPDFAEAQTCENQVLQNWSTP
ncbi:MAG: asparagine synthase (glutamine-hydrolyzing) [Deltaproteobacteria bacterium]|nr:asparagine synthase (glutamine-hydrolyzing) [Deltaproteobacteria bacterium]